MSDAQSTDEPVPAHRFGKLIASRRRELALTQGELADHLCARSGRPTFTRNEISRYERGVRIPAASLVAMLANLLDLPVGVLRQAAAADRERRRRGR